MKEPLLRNRRIAIENRWTTVVEEKFQFEDGREGEYLIVERPRAIGILPLEDLNGELFTYLVRQYRYPVGQEVWQFPMGSLEAGKSAQEQARDELRQETGLVADHLEFLCQFYSDPGLSRQSCSLYLASGITSRGVQELDETERDLVCQRVAVSRLDSLIDDGTITDLWGYSCVRILQDYLRRARPYATD